MRSYPQTYEQAVVHESDAAKLVAQNKTLRKRNISPDSAVLALHETIQALVPVGMYRHFKSTPADEKLYDILGVEEDVNTGLFYVRYASRYGVLRGRPGLRILVGGDDSFLRPIDREVYRGPRFVLMDDVLEVD